MPSLYYRVEAPGVNILKTVHDSTVAGLLDELDLTRYFTDNVYIMSSFMSSSDYSTSSGVPKLTTNRCDVDVSYVMDKSQVPWPVETPYTTTAYGLRTSSKGTHTPLLIDSKAGIIVEHQTTACALEMSFTLSFLTFDDAAKAFDNIQNKYKGSLIQQPFNLAFSYPVSFGMLEYLISVYKCKDDYKNKDFLDYINDHEVTDIGFDIRKSQLGLSESDKELMIRCQQNNCLAQLTMDQKEPDVHREGDVPDTYSISFNLTIQFGRPTLVSIHTPVSVDNKLLPYQLFQSNVAETHYDPNSVGLYQDLMVHEFLKRTNGEYNNSNTILRLPVYDDWAAFDRQYSLYQYRPFLIVHFTLDGSETLINLGELGDVSLHPIVKNILKETGNRATFYGGLINVGVYANSLRLGPELVSLDHNLNLTILSDRTDKVYHLVISETTSLVRTDPIWDKLLIKYRYFFPLTIERNLKSLVDKKFFTIDYSDRFLNLIVKLNDRGNLKSILKTMVDLGEDTNGIYHYTQNPSQLGDYLALTQSLRKDFVLPEGDDIVSTNVRQFYQDYVSPTSRSLFVAFLEVCLREGHVSLDTLPMQFISPSRTVYPYYNGQGGFYGYNTPLRIIQYNIDI